MSASLIPQDHLGSEQDGQDFFTEEIGTLQCVLSNSFPRNHSHCEQDRIILNQEHQYAQQYPHHYTYYSHNTHYPYGLNKYPTKKKIIYKEKTSETSAQQNKADTPTTTVLLDHKEKDMYEESQKTPLPSTQPPQRVEQTLPIPTNTQVPSLPTQIQTSLENQLLNTAYIDNSEQNQIETISKQSDVILMSLLQEEYIHTQQSPLRGYVQQEQTGELASLNIDLNPKKTPSRAKKQLLYVSQQSDRQASRLLNYSSSRSINQSLSQHSINLNHIIQQHTRKYNTIPLLQQCPKRQIVVELQTNSYVQSVAIKTITAIPVHLTMRLRQCTHSDIITPIQSSYSLPSRVYLEQVKTITLCTMNIPHPQSTQMQDYFELVAYHMLKLDKCSLLCTCNTKNTVRIKENWSAGEQSCKKCSSPLKITLKGMRVRI